jgi:hypothetical protein
MRPIRSLLGLRAFGAAGFVGSNRGDLVVEPHNERDDGRRHEELYVVLRGRARFQLDGSEREAPAGTISWLPRHAGRARCRRRRARSAVHVSRGRQAHTAAVADPNTRRKTRSVLVSFYDWRCRSTIRRGIPTGAADPAAEGKQAAGVPHDARGGRHVPRCGGEPAGAARRLPRRMRRHPQLRAASPPAVPVLPELEPVVAEILANVGPTDRDPIRREWVGEYVIPAERWRDRPQPRAGGPQAQARLAARCCAPS